MDNLEQKIRKLCSLMKFETLMRDQLDATYKVLLENGFPQEVIDMSREAISPKTAIEVTVKTFGEELSEAEVDGLTAFYSSEIGQSWLSKMPKVQRKLIERNTKANMKAAMRILKERFPDLPDTFGGNEFF